MKADQVIGFLTRARSEFLLFEQGKQDSAHVKELSAHVRVYSEVIDGVTYRVFGVNKQEQQYIDYPDLKSKLCSELGFSAAKKYIQIIGDSTVYSQEGTAFLQDYFSQQLMPQMQTSIFLYGFTGNQRAGCEDINQAVTSWLERDKIDPRTVIANVVDCDTPKAIREWHCSVNESVVNYFLVYTTGEPSAKFGDDSYLSDSLSDIAYCAEGGTQSWCQIVSMLSGQVKLTFLTGLRDYKNPDVVNPATKLPYFSTAEFMSELQDYIVKAESTTLNLEEFFRENEYLRQHPLCDVASKNAQSKLAQWQTGCELFLKQELWRKILTVEHVDKKTQQTKWLEKFQQKITIVLDIDETLAAGYQLIESTSKYQFTQFFKERGLFWEINIKEEADEAKSKSRHLSHCIHPAVPVFIKALFAIQNAQIVFYSSGDKRRNLPFVEYLLRISLGDTSWEQVKSQVRIYSKGDMIWSERLEKQRTLKHPYNKNFYGQFKKDLLTVVAEQELDWTVLIDDDHSYIVPDQAKNLLKLPALNEMSYMELEWRDRGNRWLSIDEVSDEYDRTVGRLNNIYYAMGLLVHALELTQLKNISLKDALFFIQYHKIKTTFTKTQQEISLEDCYYKIFRNKIYYEAGLAYLKQYQPDLDYLLPHQLLSQSSVMKVHSDKSIFTNDNANPSFFMATATQSDEPPAKRRKTSEQFDVPVSAADEVDDERVVDQTNLENNNVHSY